MNDEAARVRWDWESQDRKWAFYALVWLAIITAICTLHPGDYPALNHVANNAINGATWIGMPAALMFAALQSSMPGFLRVGAVLVTAIGMVGGIALIAGMVV